jgi:hypothetical protein
VAGRARPDLRQMKKCYQRAQAGARFAGDAAWNPGRSPNRLTEIRLLGTLEHGFYRAGESDGPTWGGSPRPPHLGYGSAVLTPAGPPRVVARVLSLCTAPCLAAGEPRAATRRRGSASCTTLPAADARHGSRQNPSPMDGARSALVPLAKGLRLSFTEAGCGWRVLSRGSQGR